MDYFVGIDVSKETLDIAVVCSEGFVTETKLENQPRSVRGFLSKFIKQWGSESNQLVVCLEHTGMYSNILLNVLLKLNLKICIESAVQIQKSQGLVRGKSDRIDARRIAQYALKNQERLRFWAPPRPVLQKIQALLVLRDRFVKIKSQLEVPIQESNQFIDPIIAKALTTLSKAPVKVVTQSIKRLEIQIDKLINGDVLLKNQCKYATSVPGIGKLTALSMIITSGDFQKIMEPKQFACYAGVAPFMHESGTSIRGRSRVSKMANMSVKKLLHMAALSAIQCNEELRSFYSRKVSQGKNKMSVLNAVRNKLISRVYSCVKQDRMYEKIYQNAIA